MRRLHIATLHVDIPAHTVSTTELAGNENSEQEEAGWNPIRYLIDRHEQQYGPSDSSGSGERVVDIPVFPNPVSDELIALMSNTFPDTDLFKFPYFCYCHETIEPTGNIVPALRVKKMLDMREAIPFSVSCQGSMALVSAVETVHVLHTDESPFLLTIADALPPPISRLMPSAYPIGDSISLITMGYAPGKYEVLHYCQKPHHLPTDRTSGVNLFLMKAPEWRNGEDICLIRIREMVKELPYKPDACIVPRISPRFNEAANNQLESMNIPSFVRSKRQEISFLGSDPLVTLAELEEECQLSAGMIIACFFVSLRDGVGMLLLRKRYIE